MGHKVSGPRVKWTPEMDKTIMEMRAAGIHKSEIAQKLGQTMAAVDGRYFKLKRELKEKAND